jgi:hypothetical protein
MEGIRMQKRHVELDNAARKKIKMVLRSKRVTMEAKKRAQILLDIDESGGGKPERVTTIRAKRGASSNTITNVRRKYVEGGIDAAIFRKKRETPPVAAKVTGEVEAHIIAVCCSAPPEGREHWSMKMIADKMVIVKKSIDKYRRLRYSRNGRRSEKWKAN